LQKAYMPVLVGEVVVEGVVVEEEVEVVVEGVVG
jgi:hypothetical protein